MRSIRSFLGLALVAPALLAGCGGEAHDATSKELASLTAEIARLRADQSALSERLSALERGRSAPPASRSAANDPPPAPAASPSLDGDRPSLDVVRLGPSEEVAAVDAGDVDEEGPRTVLRSSANGIIVEETGPGGATRPVSDAGASKKGASKRSDRAHPKKTASVYAP